MNDYPVLEPDEYKKQHQKYKDAIEELGLIIPDYQGSVSDLFHIRQFEKIERVNSALKILENRFNELRYALYNVKAFIFKDKKLINSKDEEIKSIIASLMKIEIEYQKPKDIVSQGKTIQMQHGLLFTHYTQLLLFYDIAYKDVNLICEWAMNKLKRTEKISFAKTRFEALYKHWIYKIEMPSDNTGFLEVSRMGFNWDNIPRWIFAFKNDGRDRVKELETRIEFALELYTTAIIKGELEAPEGYKNRNLGEERMKTLENLCLEPYKYVNRNWKSRLVQLTPKQSKQEVTQTGLWTSLFD